MNSLYLQIPNKILNVVDRGIIVISYLSISLYLFSILLRIFLVLCLFYGFVDILDERGGKELKPG